LNIGSPIYWSTIPGEFAVAQNANGFTSPFGLIKHTAVLGARREWPLANGERITKQTNKRRAIVARKEGKDRGITQRKGREGWWVRVYVDGRERWYRCDTKSQAKALYGRLKRNFLQERTLPYERG
jgi:hypothetical protein